MESIMKEKMREWGLLFLCLPQRDTYVPFFPPDMILDAKKEIVKAPISVQAGMNVMQ